MAAILGPAAQTINADTAGLTHAEPATTTNVSGPTFSDVLTGIGSEYGGLSHLFGGDITPVETAVTIPTDSVRGRLGGLVPAVGSILSGPGTQPQNDSVNDPGTVQPTMPGQVAANVANAPGGYANVATGAVSRAIASVRGVFGI